MGDSVVSQHVPQLYAQSLKSKPASEHGAVKPTLSSQTPVSQIPPYLIWGLVPAAQHTLHQLNLDRLNSSKLHQKGYFWVNN